MAQSMILFHQELSEEMWKIVFKEEIQDKVFKNEPSKFVEGSSNKV